MTQGVVTALRAAARDARIYEGLVGRDTEAAEPFSYLAVRLDNLARVTEVHGLAGLHGYMACFDYGTPVTDPGKFPFINRVNDILKGGY